MDSFNNVPVFHLELDDVKSDGTLKIKNEKSTIVMIQGGFCGWCKKAKPALADFAKNNNTIVCCTVVIDGNESEKSLNSMLSKIIPNYKGVPTFYGITKDEKIIGYSGDRSVKSFEEFAKKLV